MSLADDLRNALRAARSPGADASIEPLPDSGLAHAHLRLAVTGVLARVPKQSQMDLPALANLDYQAACFTRAAAGGHAPRLHGVLPPSATIPPYFEADTWFSGGPWPLWTWWDKSLPLATPAKA